MAPQYFNPFSPPDIPEFFLIGLHARPDSVVQELDRMDEAFDESARFYGNQNGIILGDLNADCSFLSMTRNNALDLVMQSDKYTFLINRTADTTTAPNDCAYDR